MRLCKRRSCRVLCHTARPAGAVRKKQGSCRYMREHARPDPEALPFVAHPSRHHPRCRLQGTWLKSGSHRDLRGKPSQTGHFAGMRELPCLSFLQKFGFDFVHMQLDRTRHAQDSGNTDNPLQDRVYVFHGDGHGREIALDLERDESEGTKVVAGLVGMSLLRRLSQGLSACLSLS